MSFVFQKYQSPVGILYLVAKEESLCAVVYRRHWNKERRRFAKVRAARSPVLTEAIKQLKQYFTGRRKTFDLPLKVEGTDFQLRVWSALSEVPFGITRSYKDQAQKVKAPTAFRAVGRVNGMNLLSIVLPCHRILGSDGSLTGYAGGLKAKRYLLKHEGIAIE